MIIPGTTKEILEALFQSHQISVINLIKETGISAQSLLHIMAGKIPAKEMDMTLICFYCRKIATRNLRK
ncbi:MAG: hypothetical protein A3F17_09025 [Gammaproteobacteria bacterium RIFCSPHIGHO2_12_FULL_41_15]|nr:MAG: hypothetical protein A3F17_09025 [Gammaproteobacteria bacterium RIFCSPHIGHO2_12_FULL_41_15]